MREPARLAHLDGLRGIAAVIVFVAHLTIVVLPSIFNGLPIMARLKYEYLLAGTPLDIFWAANFAVCIFFVMSALVLSYFYEREGGNFVAVCIRRYIRLATPIVAISFIVWLIWQNGWMFNLRAQQITQEGWLKGQYNTAAPDFAFFLWESFYKVFAVQGSLVNPVLWTMKFEMIGSLAVFALYALVPQTRIRVLLLLIGIPVFFKTYYICFVGGVLIYEWTKAPETWRAAVPPWATWCLLVAGLYMGAFPYNVATVDNIWFGFMVGYLKVDEWHQIGAIPLVFACVSLPPAIAFLSRPLPRYLGKISFSLYLIHAPLICSLYSAVVVGVFSIYPTHRGAIFLGTVVVIPAVFLCAHFLYKWVDRPAMIWSAKAQHFIEWLTIFRPEKPLDRTPAFIDDERVETVGNDVPARTVA
jgi:peptidoglycan/LPS O-acetylase OafA/YrhL